jgi:hypothetical protein
MFTRLSFFFRPSPFWRLKQARSWSSVVTPLKAPFSGRGSTARCCRPSKAGYFLSTRPSRRAARGWMSDPRAERDALIAATALVHGLILATRNAADFQPMGVDLLNPWE